MKIAQRFNAGFSDITRNQSMTLTSRFASASPSPTPLPSLALRVRLSLVGERKRIACRAEVQRRREMRVQNQRGTGPCKRNSSNLVIKERRSRERRIFKRRLGNRRSLKDLAPSGRSTTSRVFTVTFRAFGISRLRLARLIDIR